MTKIYSNIELSLDQQGEIWSASNGATRRTLVELVKDHYEIALKRMEEKRKEKDLQAGTLFGYEM